MAVAPKTTLRTKEDIRPDSVDMCLAYTSKVQWQNILVSPSPKSRVKQSTCRIAPLF